VVRDRVDGVPARVLPQNVAAMNVPILDEAYMERRRVERELQARLDVLGDMWRFGRLPDTAESLREKYVSGAVTFEEFEERIDEVLR
jgi:plasmid stabilization system protein ParE